MSTPDELPDGIRFKVVPFRLPDDYAEERAKNRAAFRQHSDPEAIQLVTVLSQRANDFIAADLEGMSVPLTDVQRIVTSVLVAHTSLAMGVIKYLGDAGIDPSYQMIMSLIDVSIDVAIHEVYPLLGARGDAS
jgi:hypothetical protein